MTLPYKILLALAVLLGSNAATGWFAYDKGQQAERTGVQVQALRQIERAQEQTDVWRAAYENAVDAQRQDDDKQRPALARIERSLERMRNNQPRAADVPRGTPEAVGETYEEAERDIVGCAESVGRFSAEAADAARSHQSLDASWPTRSDARAAREGSRVDARRRD